MKQLVYCMLLLVLSAVSAGQAAEMPAAKTQSILVRVPGIEIERYVPKNLLDLEKIVNPAPPGISSAKESQGKLFRVQGVAEAKMLTYLGQSWDTSAHAWWSNYSITNTYDANGDMTETVTMYAYIAGTPLTNSVRQTYTYNAHHQPSEMIGYVWNGTEWNLASRQVFTYDGSNRVTAQVLSTRVSNAWVTSSQTLFSYGTGTNPIEYLGQTWLSGAWVNSSKSDYNYTAWDAIADYAYYGWVSNAWVGYAKYTYSYDGNHHQILLLAQNGSGASWVNLSQQLFTFDANGDNTQTIYQQWVSGAWENSGRSTYTYDSFHGMLTAIYDNWDNGAWVADNRITYTYNDHHLATVVLSQNYIGGTWWDGYRNTYRFDAAGNVAEYTGQTNYDGGGWKNESHGLYTWYGVAAGVHDTPALAAGYKLNANYPNPFNPSTKISYNVGKTGLVSLTVFDMLGREVASLVNEQQTPGEYSITWNAGSAASGLYYYRLSAGGFTLTNSMMLVK